MRRPLTENAIPSQNNVDVTLISKKNKNSIFDLELEISKQSTAISDLETAMMRDMVSRRSLKERWGYIRGNITSMTEAIGPIRDKKSTDSTETRLLQLWNATDIKLKTLQSAVTSKDTMIGNMIQHIIDMTEDLGKMKQTVKSHNVRINTVTSKMEEAAAEEFLDQPNWEEINLDEIMGAIKGAQVELANEISKLNAAGPKVASRKKRQADNGCVVRSYLGQANSSDCCSSATEDCYSMRTPVKCNINATTSFMGKRNVGCQVAYTQKYVNFAGEPVLINSMNESSTSCSISCLQESETVSLFLNQPNKPGCICPFLGKLFESVVEENRVQGQTQGLSVLQKKTIMVVGDKSYVFTNKVDFSPYCCSGKLAKTIAETTYKHLKCNCNQANKEDKTDRIPPVIYVDVLAKTISFVLGMPIANHYGIATPYLIVVGSAWWFSKLPVLLAECLSESYDLNMVIDNKDTVTRYINLNEDTCFKIGTVTYQVSEIVSVYKYQFMTSFAPALQTVCNPSSFACGEDENFCTTYLKDCKETCTSAKGLWYQECFKREGYWAEPCTVSSTISVAAGICLTTKAEYMISAYSVGSDPITKALQKAY